MIPADEPLAAHPGHTRALSAGDVLDLQRRAGNKAVGAVLARDRATEVRVELRTQPTALKQKPAVKRTTAESMRLAEEVDAVDKLGDDELKGLRAKVAVEAAGAGNEADQAAREAAAAASTGTGDTRAAMARVAALRSVYETALRRLEAIEYVASERRLTPLKPDRFDYQDTYRALANRRANFRLEVEARVRKTGSLNAALAGMPSDAEEVQTIRKEAESFASDFRSSAWLNAERMLVASQNTMYGVTRSYGFSDKLVDLGVAKYRDEDVSRGQAAQWVVDKALEAPSEVLEKTLNAKAPERSRARLAFAATRLKTLQADVKKYKAIASGLNSEWAGVGPKNNAMQKAQLIDLPHAQKELKAAWLEAEREHKVLASYRGFEKDLENVNLGDLGAPASRTDQQMKDVLEHILPRLRDNRRALWLLRNHRLEPLTMPPVVAMTQATMFVPQGSIRAGVIRDLLDAEKKKRESWLLALAGWALLVITLLPTGGLSAAVMVPVGLASAGIAAYSALKIYETYERQQMLVNTDLDLARALSNEEPSLRGFAMNLVNIGLEGFALFRLWRKAVELRKLAIERQTMTEALRDFKALIRQDSRLSDDLIDDVLRGTEPDLKASAKPPANEPPGAPSAKPPTPPGGKRPPGEEPPRPGGGGKPPRGEEPPTPARSSGPRKLPVIRVPPTDQAVRLLEKFKTRAEFVAAIEKRLAVSGTVRPLGWERAFEALRATRGRANKKILEKLDRVMSALQNPKRYAEVLGEAWDLVKGGSAADINEALIAMASSGRLRVTSIGAIQPGGQFFKQVVSRKEYWIDHALAMEDHGEMTHLLQDLIVDRALGGPGRSAEFRSELLAKAEGKIQRYVQGGPRETPSRWVLDDDGKPFENTLFTKGEAEMTTGDYVWRWTYDLFYPTAKLAAHGRLPQPEHLRPILNSIGIGLR